MKITENPLEDLKPGDDVALFASRGFRGDTIRLAKVERVTKLYVIVDGVKYSKRYGRTVGGSSGYRGPRIAIPTPAIRERIARDRIRFRALNAIDKIRKSPNNGGVGGDDRDWSRLEADALREIAKASTPDAFDAWITRLRNAAAIEVLVAALERLERDDSTARRETARWLSTSIAELRHALNPDTIPAR